MPKWAYVVPGSICGRVLCERRAVRPWAWHQPAGGWSSSSLTARRNPTLRGRSSVPLRYLRPYHTHIVELAHETVEPEWRGKTEHYAFRARSAGSSPKGRGTMLLCLSRGNLEF